MRGLLFLLSIISFAAALVSAVLDVTRSIANSALVMTPVFADWTRFHPQSLVAFRQWVVDTLPAFAWTPVMETALMAPSWSVLAVLGMVLSLFSRPRRRRWQDSFN